MKGEQSNYFHTIFYPLEVRAVGPGLERRSSRSVLGHERDDCQFRVESKKQKGYRKGFNADYPELSRKAKPHTAFFAQ